MPQKPFRYLSVCSGIEGATVAWHHLGWMPAAFAEIDKFPSAVLKHHYSQIPNFGNFTKVKGDEYGAINLLVGGTPCQDFSVAGLRAGMDGDRGQLTIEFARLAERLRPRWLVWENVPGVLSSDGGRAFGTFLGILGKLGYGIAYRVLDAQYFGVPQRRRRVFVVGCLGDWRRAAAVLFERESLSGNPPPRREAGKRVAGPVAGSTPSRRNGGSNPTADQFIESPGQYWDGSDTADTLDASNASNASKQQAMPEKRRFQAVVCGPLASGGTPKGHGTAGVNRQAAAGHIIPVAHVDTLPTTRAAASQDGPGHAARSGDTKDEYVIPVAYGLDEEQNAHEEQMGCLKARTEGGGFEGTVAFQQNTRDEVRLFGGDGKTVGAIAAKPGMKQQNYIAALCEGVHGVTEMEQTTSVQSQGGKAGQGYQAVRRGMQVRRLTPIECERLMGFPDNYTKINPQTADGPRYKALGNSFAVPVVRWIGERIQEVENLHETI